MNEKQQNFSSQPSLKEAIPELAEIILRAYVANGDGLMFDPAKHQTLQSLFETAQENDFGDPLFYFIVAELNDTADSDVGGTLDRLDRAINETLRVRNAIAQRLGKPAGIYINQGILESFVGTARQLTLNDMVNPQHNLRCETDSLIDELAVENESMGNGSADYE